MPLPRWIILAVASLLLLPPSLHAATVGNVGAVNQGQDAYGTPVGITGPVFVGNHEESGDTLEDYVGQGGNAITINMSDELASLAAFFTVTSGGASCGSPGVQNVNLNANTEVELCAQIHAGINQGCSMRPDGRMDIVVQFLCTITHWEFQTGVVPARVSTVDITGVTDAEAASVDFFRMNHGGQIIQADAQTFNFVNNGAQLAQEIGFLSATIGASYSGTTLTITSRNTGPTNYSDIQLEFITAATTTSVVISQLTEADAAAVNDFRLLLSGIPVDDSGVNYAGINSIADLATGLNSITGINVSKTGSDVITISAASPGYITFSGTALIIRPEIQMNASAAGIPENGSVVVDAGLLVAYDLPGNLAGAFVTLDSPNSGVETLSFTPAGGITGSFAGNTLTLTGSASIADYQSALRSVVFDSQDDDPSGDVSINFSVHDSIHSSLEASRSVVITPVNDAPVVAVNNSPLAYNEGGNTVVDSQLTVEDVDNLNLASAEVSISNGFQPSEDVLQFVGGGGVSGVYTGGTLSLTGPASAQAFRDVLRSVTYHNTSEDPDESDRTIAFVVNDGALNSAMVTRLISVTGINDDVVVETSPGNMEYAYGQILTIDENLNLEDVDTSDITSAAIKITGEFMLGEDYLRFVDQAGISGDYDDTTGNLTLSGSASLQEYKTALQSVAYENISSSPTLSLRTVSFEVTDGSDLSNTAEKQILMPLLMNGFEN